MVNVAEIPEDESQIATKENRRKLYGKICGTDEPNRILCINEFDSCTLRSQRHIDQVFWLQRIYYWKMLVAARSDKYSHYKVTLNSNNTWWFFMCMCHIILYFARQCFVFGVVNDGNYHRLIYNQFQILTFFFVCEYSLTIWTCHSWDWDHLMFECICALARIVFQSEVVP